MPLGTLPSELAKPFYGGLNRGPEKTMMHRDTGFSNQFRVWIGHICHAELQLWCGRSSLGVQILALHSADLATTCLGSPEHLWK